MFNKIVNRVGFLSKFDQNPANYDEKIAEVGRMAVCIVLKNVYSKKV
jgi:hypothetical protein